METKEAPARPTPESLLLRFRETRDPRTLGDLYDATAPHLFRVALALAPDEASAEDALQETYLALVKSAGSWDPTRPALPWLGGILRLCILEARRRDRRAPDPDRLARRSPPDDPAAAAERDEENRVAASAMENLPEPYREVAILRWRYGLEPSEIAHARGVPPGTVRSLLHRAAAAMRRAVGALPAILFGDRAPRGLDRLRADIVEEAGRALVPATVGAAAATAVGAALLTKSAVAGIILATAALGLGGYWFLRPAETGMTDAGDSAPVAAPAPSAAATPAPRAERQGEQAPPLQPAATPVFAPVDVPAPAPRPAEAVAPAKPPAAVLSDLARRLRKLEGRVLDRDGKPLEGAVVFLGNDVTARGDEPFKPWDPFRAKGATRTGSDGKFKLPLPELESGENPLVTAWHEKHGPVTAPLDEALEMRLPPRGSIRARLVDAGGSPRAWDSVTMDQSRFAKADEEGSFVFEGVEAGVRGLLLPGQRWVTVRVEPDPVGLEPPPEIEIGPGVDIVRIEVQADRRPVRSAFEGALVGTDRLASFSEVKGAGECSVRDVLRGRYWLVARPFLWASVEVEDRSAVADAGLPGVTIVGEPGSTFFLVPVGDLPGNEELLALMSARVAAVKMPATGRWPVPLLPPGRWHVWGEGTSTSFTFTGEKIEVALKSGPGAKGRK